MIKKGLPYVFQIIILGIGLIMPKVELYQKIIGYLCILGSLLYFIIYFITTNYKPKFLRNILNKPLNNPDHFIGINIEALKAHLISWNESYKTIIKKVVLYNASHATNMPTMVKYILYFDLEYNRETESTRIILEEYFKKQVPISGEEFKNIYINIAPNNYKDEWELTPKKPEGVNEEFSFALYP